MVVQVQKTLEAVGRGCHFDFTALKTVVRITCRYFALTISHLRSLSIETRLYNMSQYPLACLRSLEIVWIKLSFCTSTARLDVI
jgi:hypothetical protein